MSNNNNIAIEYDQAGTFRIEVTPFEGAQSRSWVVAMYMTPEQVRQLVDTAENLLLEHEKLKRTLPFSPEQAILEIDRLRKCVRELTDQNDDLEDRIESYRERLEQLDA